jgi:tRNA threonylcarbamoyladenosine biosynthesis protein TsaB
VSDLAVALETSAREASVAVRRGMAEVEVLLEPARAHAGDLLPALDRILRELGASPRELSVVLVGTGPGSYTGLRVGIATALGIARGSGAVLRGVPSGETLCFGRLRPGEEAAVLLDARAGELYFAHFRRTEDEVEVVRAPCVLHPDEVAAVLPSEGPIFGDATAFESARLAEACSARLRAGAVPRAKALLSLGSTRILRFGGQAPADVAPLYLRPFAVSRRRR